MDNGREDKNPWTKWYWQDWDADKGLQSCGLAAKGLWMEMLSIMAKSKTKGKLLDNESKMESKTLANLTRSSVGVVEPLLDELRSHGVFSEDAEGIVFNRRMVRSSELSDIRSRAGKLGGRPKSKPKANQKSKSKAASASASAYASSSELLNQFLTTLTEADKNAWKKAYPACNIDLEIAKAMEWVKANPAKGRKSNWRKFINGWLNRTQDGGGTKSGQGKPDRLAGIEAWAKSRGLK